MDNLKETKDNLKRLELLSRENALLKAKHEVMDVFDKQLEEISRLLKELNNG